MDESAPHQESPVSHTSSVGSLPSIGTLFSDSWHVFTKSLVHLLLLTLILFAAGCVWFIAYVGLAMLALWGVIQPFIDGKMQVNPATIVSIAGSIGLLLLFVIGGYLLLMLLFIVIHAAEMVVVDEYATTASVGRALKRGFKKLFPLILVGIVTSVIIFGGFFFLIIPAFLFMLFFVFTSYEIVLNNNSIWGAVKRSTAIVMHNFGGVFARMVLIFIVSLVIGIGMQYMQYSIGSVRGLMIGTFWLFIIFQILFSWYVLVYSITLYKQARAITPVDQKVNMGWILVVSLLGWLMFAGVVYAGYQVASSEQFKTMWAGMMATKNPEKPQQQLTYVPSICGVEAALPATKDTYKGQKRQWTYDEGLLTNESFRVLNPQTTPIENVQATYIWYKNPEESILDGTTYKTFPGIEILCADNTRKLNLDTYRGLVLANRAITVADKAESYTTKGGVKLLFLQIEGKTETGKTYADPAFIGVSKDGKKLLYIRVWGANEKDPKGKVIETDGDKIFDSFRYGITGYLPTPTLVPQRTQYVAPQQQTYVAPTIAPGALGSKEWKEQFEKDYQAARAATGN